MLGAVERKRQKAVLQIVHQRDCATLLPIIKQHVQRESKIYSDQWGAYMSLNEEGYLHETVNHSEAFKSLTGYCTNTVEGLWSLAKLKIKKMRGVLHHRLPVLLDEFMYRYHYGFNNGDVFMRMLSDIGKYNG